MKRNNKGSAGREAGRLFLNPQAVIYGLILAFLWTGLIAFFLGFCGFYIRGLGERADTLVLVAGLGGACLGAGAEARRGKNLGWLHGGLVGFAFILLSYLLGFIWERGTGRQRVLLSRLLWAQPWGCWAGCWVLIPVVGSRLSVIETVNS